MTDLTIDGEIFRVQVEGDPDRPTVLLSCSLGTDLSLFDAQMPALLEHFRVVRYDPRGHGRSTSAGAPYTLARLGADALAILDELGIDQVHVVGLSMGGVVAQWLLVNAPERIGRAVLANTAARIGTAEVWNTRIRTVLAEGTGALASATMERWFSAAFRETAPDRVAAVETLFRATSAPGYAGGCAALRDADLREAIRAVDRDVLILTGRDDPVTSEADIAVMTDAIAGSRHVVLDCRHISNIEAAAAFNAAMIEFLTAKAPARIARPRLRKRTAPDRRPARGRVVSARSSRTPVGARAKAAKPSPVRADPATKPPARKTKPASAKATTAKPATAKTTTASPPAKPRAAAKSSPKKTARAARPGIAKTSAARTRVAETTAAKKPAAKKVGAKKTTAKKATVPKKPAARRRPTKTPTRPGRRRT